MKEIEAYTAKKTGSIMLNANELPFPLSDEIKAEIKAAVDEIMFHRYPDETNASLIKAYADVKQLDEHMILAGNGSDEMLGLLIGTFLGKGKKLFTLAPDFSMYDYYASMHEADVIKYACEEDGSFDIEDFIEKGREYKIDMILFSNPNNPSGHFLKNSEIVKIVEAFPTIPVIIDEAYGEFASESMIKHLEDFHNLYVTRTLSKAFGLAGARLGFLISNPHNIAKLRVNVVPYNISGITQSVGTIVLRHASEYVPYVEEIKAQRDAMYEKVKNLKAVKFYPSCANYLYGKSKYKDQLIAMLEEKGIIIRTYQDDSFRITIGTREENTLVYSVLEALEKEVC